MNLQTILQLKGQNKGFAYLRHRFSDPANIAEYLSLFPNHITDKSPDFHIEILHEITKGGRHAIGAPRGFAKSTITNVVSASWFSLYSKYHFILIISDTYTQAKLQLGALKAELENNKMIHGIFGNPVSNTWGEDRIIVNGVEGQTLIMALGAGMKIRGLKYKQYRPELAIIDDLENQDVVNSKDRRDKLERWFKYDLQPGISPQNNNIIYLGTILHHNALLKKVIERQEGYASWRTKLYKAITDGKSLWEERYPLAKLEAMRDNPEDDDYVGSLVFAQEYQNEPQDDKDRIIKTEYLDQTYRLSEVSHVWKLSNPTVEKEWHEEYFSKIIAGVDPAISERETADYLAMITIGIAKEDGHIWILDYIRDRIGDPLRQVQVIIENYLTWKHDSIKVEVVAYQQGLYNLLRSEGAKQGIYPPLSAFRPDKDKVRRAKIHSSIFSGKLVHVRTDHALHQAFRDELLQFPLGEHDDMLDAFMNASEEKIKRNKARTFTKKASIFR